MKKNIHQSTRLANLMFTRHKEVEEPNGSHLGSHHIILGISHLGVVSKLKRKKTVESGEFTVVSYIMTLEIKKVKNIHYYIPISDTTLELSVFWPSDTESHINELRFSESISLSFKTRLLLRRRYVK